MKEKFFGNVGKKIKNLAFFVFLVGAILCVAAGISHASMAKLGKNENVTTDVLVKICTALQCDISDIMELTVDTND